ncbi:hypothetical protein BD779DRAFT_1486613 [Infundibulicybe gibba]|nr:hypothetical protein BD779DRAFT_1486613 [Infundibulicybe gibba]
MILAPPAGVLTPQPSYYIYVNMNCFTPSSTITTIKRGSWDGEFVGDFEMGLPNSKKPPTVCIRNNECLITQVLDSKILAFRNAWTWRISEPKKQTLYWDEGVNTLSCFSSKTRTNDNFLAKFMTPAHLRRQGRATELTRLEVSPQGHEFFDDILLSALIIERTRTTSS